MKNINLDNIRNNLSNVCYLYENLRFDDRLDCITIEYESDHGISGKVLKKKLEQYFLNQAIDTIDVSPLQHLVLEHNDALFRSYSAFRRINGISIDKKDKHVIIDLVFLTSIERANSALELLEENNINDFLHLYPEMSELNLYEPDRSDNDIACTSSQHSKAKRGRGYLEISTSV